MTYNCLYAGDMAEDGYIYISLDNRGTPAPKGKGMAEIHLQENRHDKYS